ncbi:MAG: DUF559 domain-containing protein [Bacteroidales bacterium]|nr:DUF559 domain-containing protein [Bacteroidales bacterium]MBQ3555997.1 DUF559 domain-containing protein [Bacteroidales bacterium]MBR3609276.1 DUF559 domain-containing protein [Bacteroidales bacterium]
MVKKNNYSQVNNRQELIEERKSLRTFGTSAEAMLWLHLKNKQLDGWRWRRQFSVGPYIIDFYCPKAKLGIELDGNNHYSLSGMEYDDFRTIQLYNIYGVKLLRFENNMIWKDIDSVLYEIKRVLQETEIKT